MKEKYIKYKKQIRSFLSLGTTFSALGLFGFIGKSIIGAIVLSILGIITLLFTFYLKKKTIEIEKHCKNKCLICNNNISYSSIEKHYISNNLVSKEDFDKTNNNKTKMLIEYYKCIDCHFCLTIITSTIINNNKEKIINPKINMDFDYNGDY